MPEYFYNGFDQNGGSEAGSISANSENLAFDILQSRGITVFELHTGTTETTKRLPFYRRDIRFGSDRISLEEQATTAELLSTLFGAGLSTSQVIRIAILSAENPQIKSHFERIGILVADGTPFSEAFASSNRSFSPLFVSFLKVSDAANTAPNLLKELATHFRKQNSMRQRVVSALIYPTILVLAAIALLFIVILYLAPSLAPIFSSVGKEPSGTLAALLWANGVLTSYGNWILAVTIAGTAMLALALQAPPIRGAFSAASYRFPVFGRLIAFASLARLTQSTELLISSGEPLPAALRISARIAGPRSPFFDRFEEAAEAVEAGQKATAVLEKDKRIPASFIELFRIGEETNNLKLTLAALSESLSQTVDRTSQRLLLMMTPILTLIVGLGIGLLIYTLMGALLEVNELAF